MILSGHLGLTTVGEKKKLNLFGKGFLRAEDWEKNYYVDKEVKKFLDIPPEERI